MRARGATASSRAGARGRSNADKIVVLNQGNVAEEGSHDALIAKVRGAGSAGLVTVPALIASFTGELMAIVREI